MRRYDILKRFMDVLGKSRFLIMFSFIISVVFSALGMLIPYYAGKAIDCLSPVADVDKLIIYVFIIVLLAAGCAVLQFVLNIINNRVSYDAVMELRNSAYRKTGRIPVSTVDRVSTGKLQSLIINDCETVGDGLILFLNQFFSGVTSILFTLGIMIRINFRIALFVILFTPVSFIFSELIARGSFKSFKKQSLTRSVQTEFITESSSNYRSDYIFEARDTACRRFESINEEYKKISGQATFLSSITNPSTRFVNALIYAGVAFIGSGLATGDFLTAGQLTSLLAYSNQFMKPFNDLSSVYTELTDSFACLDRIFTFLDEDELDDDLDLKVFSEIWDPKGDFEIEFKDVTFSYIPGIPVLKGISFKVSPGASCAIVGPTGCGKTTIINLLLRFYEPDSGEILINGVNIAGIPRNILRSYIGTVSQDTWFRDGTVADNIRFGKPGASMDECRDSALRTGADSFIRRLPLKYEERISSSKGGISEGQRQLLSITRAMRSEPSILILDEATSSVDILTEVRIQRAVQEILEGRTAIIIAHRLSTIIDADMIVVIEKGQVTETGRHKELMSEGGFYSRLYASYTEE